MATKRDPRRTQERILTSATTEFAQSGFGGARVDMIAKRAGINKSLIYHYFQSKDGLFRAVMERAYRRIRLAEQDLDLLALDPLDAVVRLTRFTFRYFVDNPEFIRLLNEENLYKAEHIRDSRYVRDVQSPLVEQLGQIVEKGEAAGQFRKGIEPVQLYVTIASLGYFYLSNASTLSTIFERDLLGEKALTDREEHIHQVVRAYLGA
ncbi:MAG: TetR family transcriptional regulator [Rhodospirillaceae bacterium]|nr:TetR family transcriptional regulator [Rhodospirillaceae bacterium]MBT6137593.1 TetR family transcriptional regulator [Rhodospirillaceae bacterium]